MKSRVVLLLCFAITVPGTLAGGQKPDEPTSLVARVDTTGFIKVTVDSFGSLSPKQQALSYWLAQASIAIDPIIYDQLSHYGLRQKRLLEEIVAHPEGVDPQAMTRITQFAE